MTTYFTAPDGHGDDTLWVRYDEPRDLPANPLPIIRKRDLGPMADHWDEIVARVTAGNLSAQQAWALDRAGRNTSIAYPPSRGLMQLMPEWKPSPAAFDVTPKPVDAEPPPAETFNAITDWREPVPGWETVTCKTPGSAVVTREYTVPKGQ